LKWEQKICINLLIKKKRGAQLIKEKPDENRYKETINEQRYKEITNEQHPTDATTQPMRQTNNHSKPASTELTTSN
jgi:hypothetical protein